MDGFMRWSLQQQLNDNEIEYDDDDDDDEEQINQQKKQRIMLI